MDDLLTTREVLELLKIDRITIYRMLQDGRIKGVKVGAQWRFPRPEVERLMGRALPAVPAAIAEPPQAESPASFPAHCVQTVQDLFSEVGQISALVVDLAGEPLTEVSQPCRFCRVLLQNPQGQAACRATWSEIARQSAAGTRYFTCHAGLQYLSAPVQDGDKTIAYFLAGEFYWQDHQPAEEAGRVARLVSAFGLPQETLQPAAAAVPVIPAEQHARVEAWPATAARAVQSILHERTSFMDRLQRIASLTQIH